MKILFICLFFFSCCRLSEHTLVINVDAKHLDYSSNRAFLLSVIKNRGYFGHAWIELYGPSYKLVGGHSGECGILQPKYFDGIMDYNEMGDPNPIKYLWEDLNDGFFQKGSGGHKATYSINLALTKEQFNTIRVFIENYDFTPYSLRGKQCCSFVSEVAKLAGIHLEYKMKMSIQQSIWFRGYLVRFWEDPKYSIFHFGSPDVLEDSLKKMID